MGVCNGFQILLETGLLPGTLVRNADLKFVCRETSLAVQKTTASLFTDGLQDGQVLTIPVAHNEGNYFAPEDQLAMLEDNGQIALRYTEGSHPGPANPNGAAHDIASIISENGRVMGMMPHPERLFRAVQMSYRPNDQFTGEAGPWLKMFQNARNYVG